MMSKNRGGTNGAYPKSTSDVNPLIKPKVLCNNIASGDASPALSIFPGGAYSGRKKENTDGI